VVGLADDEMVVALVHLGPPVTDPPAKERAPVDDVFTVLP
jgi:nitroreductase